MKKTFAILFTLVFLISMGGVPVQARAQSSFAYIPLISPAGKPSVPIEFRARQAFDALAPRLLQAQANGQIVQFEPEFNHALLKVEYRVGFDLSSALSVSPQAAPPVFADPKSVLDYIQVGNLRPAVLPDVTTGDPTINLGLYDSCFSGENLGANNQFNTFLWDTHMNMVASKHNTVMSDGTIDDCFYNGSWRDMLPGFTFTINIYDPTGITLLHTYTTVIARLNINSITLKTKTFKGIGPASDMVFVAIYHPFLNDSDDVDAYGVPVFTSNKGAWSIKLDSSAELRGGDEVEVFGPMSTPASNPFMFSRSLYIPFVDCQLGGNYCSVYGIPGKSAKITLTHAKKSYKTSGVFDYQGWAGGGFLDALTDPVFMVPGDKVVATGAAAQILPALTAVPDPVADTVSGLAPASLYFQVDLDAFFHTSGWYGDSRWVGSNAGGTYLADFSSSFAIDTADIIEASVYFVDPITGNETDYWNYISS
jgi:hypothetical protein